MGVDADDLAQREEAMGYERARTHVLPSYKRANRFASRRTEIRSTQAGGPDARPRAGTIAEQRALAAVQGTAGKKSKGTGKSGKQTYDA